jgi:redox-sensitive bicupin YhaK (pirin superfamily)
VNLPVTAGHNAFVYVYEGSVSVGESAVPFRSAGILSDGDTLTLRAGSEGARVILFAGKPLNEPVVQYGPFVMNTQEEIRRAITDYQSGSLV